MVFSVSRSLESTRRRSANGIVGGFCRDSAKLFLAARNQRTLQKTSATQTTPATTESQAMRSTPATTTATRMLSTSQLTLVVATLASLTVVAAAHAGFGGVRPCRKDFRRQSGRGASQATTESLPSGLDFPYHSRNPLTDFLADFLTKVPTEALEHRTS